MTYRDLYVDACRLVDSNKITLGEFLEMTLPLDREIEERKVGKWIKEETIHGWDGFSYQCSECGRSIHLDTEVESLIDYPYCHCGAKMEGEK